MQDAMGLSMVLLRPTITTSISKFGQRISGSAFYRSSISILINMPRSFVICLLITRAQKHLEMFNSSDIKGDVLWNVDWGKFSYKMSQMVAESIKDPSMREWILPQFTTTTKADQAVASIMIMSTVQKHFTFCCCMSCGLPSVTLSGQKSDWEKLATKAERIAIFGDKPKIWLGLLKPVLSRFIASFDTPDSKETKAFWQTIAHYSGGGSGPTYLSVRTQMSS